MALILKLVVAIAFTTAIAITPITTRTATAAPAVENKPPASPDRPKIRFSRFLVEGTGGRKPRNPNAADHCHKNPEICSRIDDGGGNSTAMACCNNKCVDLNCDHHNCGACGNKCKFTQGCCSGQCVYLAYDKRHCGRCDQSCSRGEYCVFGMCNYA